MKALKTFVKPFVAPQRNAIIKIQVKFLSSSEIGTEARQFEPQAVIPTGNQANRFFVEKPFHKTIHHHHTRQWLSFMLKIPPLLCNS